MTRLSDTLQSSDFLASAALLAMLVAIWLLAGRMLRARESLSPPAVRRWTANVRNFLLLIALIGLVMIWAPQLRTFALSLTAVAVAVVVATKEIILCLSGSALRTFTRAYSVGDYVQIGRMRGEVVDYNLLVTTLHAFEDREGSFVPTGREVLVPNSLLFGSPLKIEGEAGGRVRHAFRLVMEPDVNLFAERAAVEGAARRAMEEAEAGHPGVKDRRRKARDGQEPKVAFAFGTTELGKYRLDLEVTALPDLVGETENAIACAVLDHLHARREAELVAGPQRSAAHSAQGKRAGQGGA